MSTNFRSFFLKEAYSTLCIPTNSFLYSLGVQFFDFLKIRLKLAILLKPHSYPISPMLFSVSIRIAGGIADSGIIYVGDKGFAGPFLDKPIEGDGAHMDELRDFLQCYLSVKVFLNIFIHLFDAFAILEIIDFRKLRRQEGLVF